MKTKIFKIIITLAVSLILSASVSLAQDKRGKQHKQHGNAYGYHNNQKGHGHHPSWKKRHYKSYHHRQRPKQRYHKRDDRYELHDNHHRRYKRLPYRDGFFFGMSFNDPYMTVVIGAKGN